MINRDFIGKRRKLIRRIFSDDESDEEFKPSAKEKEEGEDEFIDDAVQEDASMDEDDPPVSKPKKTVAVTPLMERFQVNILFEKSLINHH